MIARQENSQDNKSWRHGLKWQNKALSSNPSKTRKQEQKAALRRFIPSWRIFLLMIHQNQKAIHNL
jgi:hypothetical protein